MKILKLAFVLVCLAVPFLLAKTPTHAGSVAPKHFTSISNSHLPLELPPSFGGDPLVSPAGGSTQTSPQVTFDWDDATGGVLSYTLRITSAAKTVDITTTTSIYTASLSSNGLYTWTVQAHNADEVSGFVSPLTFTLQATWTVFLPIIHKSPTCPTTSGNSYTLIPIEGPAADRPGPEHADLNLAMRGYSVTNALKVLVQYNGDTDSNAPQLDGLFEPNAYPGISEVFRVNDWDWGCGTPQGCRAGPITAWPVTLIELPVAYGTRLNTPERGPEIYGGGYRAMVSYAEENKLTLIYTRNDTVASGYTIHIENICVDSNLLALYRSQTDATGWHTTGRLPALKNNQQIGTAFVGGVRVAVRDRGAFMDPRSRKDWWMNYPAGLEIQRFHDTLLK